MTSCRADPRQELPKLGRGKRFVGAPQRSIGVEKFPVSYYGVGG